MSEHVVNLLLGGPVDLIPSAEVKQRQNETWIGVDHGNIYLLDQQIVPKIAVGDYDSLDSSELLRVENTISDVRYAQAEKDFTDSQWAVATAFNDLGATQVNIFGATGGRLDHELVNLFMMTDPKMQSWLRQVRLIDTQNQIDFYGAGEYILDYQKDYRYLAFVNLTAVRNLNLWQVKYLLSNFSAAYPVSWSSNEFLPGKSAHFSFESGIVAVILSRDKHCNHC
ncbi:thiamine diphosphokinase [Lapidilactobacillus mulanensis]|uniref:Thiamine diphosphokinase n=1 Tax=Lapidilactobacillus mulanensis TaxID=2485999 RepID=A0ABW4DP15_9LACO|nr:thiamine diphosphokinase [Lapidilactobacillus mulanensis]